MIAERFQHGQGCFAEGDGVDVLTRRQRGEVPLEGRGDACGLQRGVEDEVGVLSCIHSANCCVSHWLRAACIWSSLPTKKWSAPGTSTN